MINWRNLVSGKLIGGGAGLLLGGPLGALIGLVAGHAYDTWQEEQAKLAGRGGGRAAGADAGGAAGGAGDEAAAARGEGAGSEGAPFDSLFGDPLETRRIAFATAVIALAAKLAKADGAVTRDEIRAFKRIFVVVDEQVGGVARIYDEAKRTPHGFEAYARQVAGLFRNDPAVLEELLSGLFEVARADGRVNEAELRFLREVGRIFGFSDAAFEAIRARHEASADGAAGAGSGGVGGGGDPYAVLGLTRDATAEEIKRAYRELVREHHPDRLVAKGMPEEFVARANRKLAAINAAYDRIARERGIR